MHLRDASFSCWPFNREIERSGSKQKMEARTLVQDISKRRDDKHKPDEMGDVSDCQMPPRNLPLDCIQA